MPLSQIGGRKYPGYLKNENSMSNLYEKKSLLKSVQLWLENSQKCKFKMSVKLCDKLTWCSKIVIFSTKLNQFVPNFYRV